MYLILISLIFLSIQSQAKIKHEVFNEIKNKSFELSPEILQLNTNINQTKASLYSQISLALPQINSFYKKTHDFYSTRNALLGLSNFKESYGVEYEWTLFEKNKYLNYEKKNIELKKLDLELKIKKIQFEGNFTTLFLEHILYLYQDLILENSIKKAEMAKKEASIGFEIGQKTKLDKIKSEANLLTLESKKIQIKNEIQKSLNKLIEFSGLDLNHFEFLKEQSEVDLLTFIEEFAKIPSTFDSQSKSESSYELELLELQTKQVNIQNNYLNSFHYPKLQILGSYSNSENNFSNLIHSPFRNHTVSLLLSIPLFNSGHGVLSTIESHYANLLNNKNYEIEKQNFLHSREETLLKINSLQQEIQSLQKNILLYEELNRLTLKSYQLGKSTLIELLDSQDSLFDSKFNLAQLKIQLFSHFQNYLYKSGNL